MPTLAGAICMSLVAIIVGVQVSIAASNEPELKRADVAKGEKYLFGIVPVVMALRGRGMAICLWDLNRPTSRDRLPRKSPT